MKRLTFIALALVMVAALATPTFAQDEEPGTIADIVVASASADEPEFSTLLAAVQAADPAVLEALSDPEAELTVFAPTDAAFAALAEAVGEEAFGEILADTEGLTDILLFHVVEGSVMSSDVVAALEESDGAFSTQSLQGQFIDVSGNVEDGITVDGANLVLEMVDIEASNGVVHVIDAVITPESGTIADVVVAATEAEEPQFTTLLTAVQAADPAVLDTLSSDEVELTVFAPTDAAFEALGEEAIAGLLEDTEALTGILLYHVYAEGAVDEESLAGLLEENMGEVSITMADGSDATFTVTEEGVFINSETNNAQIIMTNVDASNGIIHVIDAVITPGM